MLMSPIQTKPKAHILITSDIFYKIISIKNIYLFIYLFIWPRWVLVAACGLLSCDMWDLVP